MLVPPYGSEEAGLETIFDVKHLEKNAYFLNTQCNQSSFSQSTLFLLLFSADRLPIPLGDFISEKVYNGKLRSEHKIADYSCIAFIDVLKGGETKQGSSWLVSGPAR
jgi:regulator of nonsense transcripts 1